MTKEVQVKIGKEKYKTEVQIAPHTLLADEPVTLGGQDLGPNPGELFLSSLGTCKAITLRMYADRKEWPLESVEVHLVLHEREGENRDTTRIACDIKLIGNLDDEQRKRLMMIADKCPVHKMLSNPIVIESNLLAG